MCARAIAVAVLPRGWLLFLSAYNLPFQTGNSLITTLVPLMEPLGIDAHINPRSTTVSSILRHIRHGRVRSVYSIGDAEAEVIEAEVLSTSPIAGKRVSDIDFPEGALMGMVRKGDEVMRPLGTTRIEEGDVIAVFCLAKDVPQVEQLMQVSIDFF